LKINLKKFTADIAPAISTMGLHRLFANKYAGIAHILMFHRVIPPSVRPRLINHECLEVDPLHLEKIILYFKDRNYRFPSLDQLPQILACDHQQKSVLFTFDDGYKDNLTYAYPIFKKHKIPFTVYITTNFINRKAVMWWYLLEEILLSKEEIKFSWEGEDHHYLAGSRGQKNNAFNQMRQFIMTNMNHRTAPALFFSIFGKHFDDIFRFTDQHSLTWPEVKFLSEDPDVTIAAHTSNHFSLKQLDYQELKKEIVESKLELESRIGKLVHHFAYPFGTSFEASKREYQCVNEQGFASAVTTRQGNIFPYHGNFLHQLPRLNINSYTSNAVLDLKTSGMVSFFKNVISSNPPTEIS
jgi:peptidoglycan/xylan/chitin deacetylase (PgdA/CDA1 family)